LVGVPVAPATALSTIFVVVPPAIVATAISGAVPIPDTLKLKIASSVSSLKIFIVADLVPIPEGVNVTVNVVED
jgi:hypothetical protein